MLWYQTKLGVAFIHINKLLRKENIMKVSFIGLGKMGRQMVRRLLLAGHTVTVFDVDEDAVEAMGETGAELAVDRKHLLSGSEPVVIWLMIPSQFVDDELKILLENVPAGSILIDGGNSDYRFAKERASKCAKQGVHWVDVGTSGGILGFENGFSMMVGGDESTVTYLKPLFEALAQPNGWSYFGEHGAGHYTKMVHNAIEYGLMESYAEGYRMLKDGPYKNIDLVAAGEVWKHGSIIRSLLNDLTVEALKENPNLDGIDGYVAESGETRWALETANELGIELPAIATSFQVRLDSQAGKINFATKLLAAMRNKFGGHAINKSK